MMKSANVYLMIFRSKNEFMALNHSTNMISKVNQIQNCFRRFLLDKSSVHRQTFIVADSILSCQGQ